jgi:FLVCR family MFS transporter 7
MEKTSSAPYRTFGYRWVVLFTLVPVIVASEIFWLTFAPIVSYAKEFYNTSSLNIDLFSMSYMLMYIVFSMPASYIIEKFGFKTSVIIGSALTVVFGATRFIFATNFAVVLVSQFLLAAGQPFLVNISTKVPANWFPVNERATASGVLLMAQYLGFILPMILSPILVEGAGIPTMLGIYAGFALLSAVVAIAFPREKPAVPPGPEAPKESMSLKNMGRLLIKKDFIPVLLLSFITMGLFNTIMTMVEQIFKPRGISSVDAGIIGAVFIVSGIIGAVVLPLISDKMCRRIPFLRTGISFLGILTAALTFLGVYWLLLLMAALMGFIIMGLAPILFQHGAEVAYPVQEGASFGTVMLMGQVSGIVFVFLFDLLMNGTGTILWPMLFLVAFALVQIPISMRMKESHILLESRGKLGM